MKTIITLSLIILTSVALVFFAGQFSEASKKIESERMATAKEMCASGSKWVKLKGELNTRSCSTFKRM